MTVQTGDLVRYVGRNPNNRPNIYGWVGIAIRYTQDDEGSPCWEVSPAMPGGAIAVKGGMSRGHLVNALSLRPIRDTPGKDESLQWAPVHSERVTA